jgi:hypothetical protein
MTRESGQAMIETILLGLLLLVPLVWMLGVLADIHRTSLAATAAVRAAGFEAARSATAPDAALAIDEAVARAFVDHGLEPSDVVVDWRSSLDRGERVEIEIGYPVPVAQAPLLGRVGGPSLWVRARHVARVDPYRSR